MFTEIKDFDFSTRQIVRARRHFQGRAETGDSASKPETEERKQCDPMALAESILGDQQGLPIDLKGSKKRKHPDHNLAPQHGFQSGKRMLLNGRRGAASAAGQ